MAENHIKSWKTHLAADRTSCSKATANQFRLFLHAGAYWLMWGAGVRRCRNVRPCAWRSSTPLRVRLIKIAARVVENEDADLPASADIMSRPLRSCAIVLSRIPRLAM